MSDKEAVLEMMRDLPAEASMREILQGIEKITASRKPTAQEQVIALRSSASAASMLNQALAAHGSTESVPLTTDALGVVRVAGTRVTLDTVVETFLDGATAEAIQEQYPSLDLSDIYAVISYYLRHQREIDDYLQVRQAASAAKRESAEQQFSPIGVRDRLLARRKTLV
jgi:uncharacterized protein (DUF433 family)